MSTESERNRNRELLRVKRLDPAYLQNERQRNAERMRLKGAYGQIARLSEKTAVQKSEINDLKLKNSLLYHENARLNREVTRLRLCLHRVECNGFIPLVPTEDQNQFMIVE